MTALEDCLERLHEEVAYKENVIKRLRIQIEMKDQDIDLMQQSPPPPLSADVLKTLRARSNRRSPPLRPSNLCSDLAILDPEKKR
jgi:hypothetical protein